MAYIPPEVVLITGKFRSGTSLAASVVHRLGWTPATTLATPVPPSWRLDWEDIGFFLPAWTQMKSEGRFRPSSKWILAYLSARRRASHESGFGGRFAIKSGLLALCLDAFIAELESVSLHYRTILCTRDEPARSTSLSRHPQLIEHDEIVANAVDRVRLTPGRIDFEHRYEDVQASPAAAIDKIAHLLGCNDPSGKSAAANLIGTPTEYN